MNNEYTPLFTDEQYNSRDGMNVNFWGKILWSFLHTVSFSIDPIETSEETREQLHAFLMSLKYILPCKACRDNYAKNLEMVDYNRDCLLNRKTFSMFVYRLHNCVNKMLGKDCHMTYNQVRDRYEIFRARCVNETPIIPKYSSTAKEQGCEIPMTGIKSKSVISVVPITTPGEPFNIDPKCIPKSGAKSNTKHNVDPVIKLKKKRRKSSEKR